MRSATLTALAFAGALAIADVYAQQPPAQPPAGGGQRMGGMGDAARKLPDGGIRASGWQGKIDASEASKGSAINDSKFEMKGSEIMVATGPAALYWNPTNTVSGDYTVSATFSEAAYMSANDHGHPYGVFIAGNKLDTDKPTALYCATYGDGRYIVRGFGPAPFNIGGRRPTAHEAVKKVEKGQPVMQEIAMSVKGGRVACSINGAEVWSGDKAEVVGEGKLESVDGIAGIRAAHNIDVKVTNFKVTK
jgi:hypothetical protein